MGKNRPNKNQSKTIFVPFITQFSRPAAISSGQIHPSIQHDGIFFMYTFVVVVVLGPPEGAPRMPHFQTFSRTSFFFIS